VKEQAVYAQLVRTPATEQKRSERHRIVTDELFPALQDEPGFVGALNLVNPGTGDAMMIVLWRSPEQAQRPLGDNGTTFLARLLHVVGFTRGGQRPPSVWEVTLCV
jgi:hypothetical protein